MSCWLSASLSLHLHVRMSKSISATIRASSAPSAFLCYLRDDSSATVTTNFTCNIFQFLSHSETKLPIALRGALRPTKHAEYFIFWEFQQLFFLSFSPLLLLLLLLLLSFFTHFCFFVFHALALKLYLSVALLAGSGCWAKCEMRNGKWKMRQEGRRKRGARGEGEQKERKNLLRVLL